MDDRIYERQLAAGQAEILKKVEEYKVTKKRQCLDDIQGIVDRFGREFVLVLGEQRVHFIPEKLKLGGDMDDKIRQGRLKKTKHGIILPSD